MSENPGGTPPRDDERAPAGEPAPPASGSTPPPVAPDPAPTPDAPPVPPAPPAAPSGRPPAPPAVPPAPSDQPPTPPAVPPAPSAGQPPAGPPPAPQYGQHPASPPPYGQPPASPPPYGQPAPGGYPPPAPQYGQAPPGAYPPAAGYGPPVQASPIGEAYSYGWTKFTQSGGLFVGAAVVWLVAVAVLLVIIAAVFGGFGALLTSGSGDGGFRVGFSVGWFVFSAVFWLLGYLIQAAFIRAALDVTEGRSLGFGDFFKFVEPGPVILTALILALINAVLGVFWVIGPLAELVVGFLLIFTFWFVIDKRLAPVDALKASVQLVTANLSTMILFFLLSVAVCGVGALVCGVGLLVAVPVVLLATAFLFKRLLGDPIAA